jgi:RNA polymerase sigma-70 factor (ECF subfamily)
MAQHIDIAEWLDESGWLRGLAASLIGDAAQADDLVQDTWLAALRRPPSADGEPRPWLARVVRNLAKNTRRDRSRRLAREEFAHEERALPSPDALAQQAEAQRLLAEAVTRLAEPLRDVIVLRYFQGLDSSAAAARLGVPAGTVRTRLARALEALRADLDGRFDEGRKAWGLMLAPLARGARVQVSTAGAVAAATAVGSGSTAPVGWGIAACALATLGTIYWSVAGGAGEGESIAAALPLASASPIQSSEPSSSGTREAIDPLPASASSANAAGTTGLDPLAGPALDAGVSGTLFLDGHAPEWPIELTLEPNVPAVKPALVVGGAGVQGDTAPRMRVRRDQVTIQPEQRGAFAFDRLPSSWSGRLLVKDFAFADGSTALELPAPRTGLVVALRSGPAIVGRVVDSEGKPVPGLEGWYQRSMGPTDQSATEIHGSVVACTTDGRFRIATPSHGDWCTLTLLFEAEGHGYREIETPPFAPADGRDLGEIVLEPVRALAFTVRDPEGAPIEGAFARIDGRAWSRRSGNTGANGAGTLAFAPEREFELRVSAANFADRVQHVAEPGSLEVVLEPLTILDIQLVGALIEQAERVRLSAEHAVFVWDASDWDEPAKLQVELGAIGPNVRRWPAVPGQRHEYEFQHQYDGHYHLVGLVPDVEVLVEVLDKDGRVLALQTTSVARETRRALELGDPNTQAPATLREGAPKRRSVMHR